MARELKPVSFNSETKADKEILDYIEELGVSFGSYVKLLIRKDMRAGSAPANTYETTNETDKELGEIASQLKELVNVFKSGNVSIGKNETAIDTVNETAIDTEKTEETEEERKQRIAMQSILNLPTVNTKK